MSATDNRTTELLCKLLDERGEDYTRNDFGVTWSYYSDPHTAAESMDGTLIVTGLTPEQAIAATLGGDECEMYYLGDIEDADGQEYGERECSECGFQFPYPHTHSINCCPNCMRKVKR